MREDIILLAEFLECEVDPDFKEKVLLRAERGRLFRFNPESNWNDLMMVVEKIESLGFWFEILKAYNNGVYIGKLDIDEHMIEVSRDTKIGSVYEACVDFVKWHNKNKP